ncbi:uncharacterized protein PRCAT00003954001, partial [Priceomyces carsonii]|uniref:uncharacterized protein n=1 Tax=Priceomyces carsonii TaxID=28549 RepID=UPI002EDBA2C6
MDSANYHSGSSRYNHESKLSSRSGYREPIEKDDVEELTARTLNLNLKPSSSISHYKRLFIEIINPLLLTALSAFVRLYMIDASKYVVWDEAHFGKFGSYYLKREFYFDVHPPLGKLLVALSGYIAGYDGSFAFDSGLEYPDNCNYVLMRAFNCLFGILCTPVVYKTAIALGFSQFTVWFISLMTIFEMISLTLSKFILLDSMLLFFTVLSYYFLVKLHNLRTQNTLLTTRGITTMVMTGVSIGCVCSVKWVGLFVTILIGFYVIYDLLIKFYQLTSTNSISFMKYICHWLSRIICLIIVPFFIYLACFKVHFTVLNHSGSGDGSISTLLQASLEGNLVLGGPRSVGFGSMVTLRSQGLSPNLLHSHPHLYPEGSRQQQITTYGFKDENNNFLIEFDLESGLRGEFATQEPLENDTYSLTRLVKNGDTVRLVHDKSDCLLHSHPIPAFVLKSQYEVSCYADLEQSDSKDEWIIEVQLQEISPSPAFKDEDPNLIHPISTNFRLRHKVLGCYLATTGYSLPSWGYQQGEVICKRSFMLKDKSTWWNIEDHVNDKLPEPEVKYVPPKPKFWKEFVLLNYGMMASNNALVPDPDKFDRLSSEWWEWPIDHSGLRMCSWGSDDVKYFLIGHPFINWFSTAALGLFLI